MDKSMRALSIRQPHAEAIMRGAKVIEFRSRLTHIRERFYVYASMTPESAADSADGMEEYGIYDVPYAELPRGVIIGTAELYDCDLHEDGEWFQWHIRAPQRAEELLKPINHPQPAWFYPFR